MIALSVRQPWCHAILLAGKRIENRDWRTSFRGRVLLHASKGCARVEYESAVASIWAANPDVVVPPLAELPRGALVGAMTVVNCVDRPPPGQERWWCGPYALVLENVFVLPRPVPCGGARGFWRVPPDVARQVRELAAGGATP